MDSLMAAMAKVHSLIVVTSNRRDFEIFEGLTTEDWRE
jgi:predicted nucleic acid-binding protein